MGKLGRIIDTAAPAYVAVGWAFPSSRTARELGRSSTGCYFLELETATSERVSISGPYSSVQEAEAEGDKTGGALASIPTSQPFKTRPIGSERPGPVFPRSLR